MTSRGFSISLIAGATLLFLSTVAANIILDPEQVFGTGLFSHRVNINERALRLDQYRQQADSTDGLLFSSSRGNLLDPKLLAKGMGLSHFFSASLSYGMITDYAPLLEYIVRDKANRAIKLKHVFLLLDVDFFGRQPWTNSNINSFLPPEISTESAARYWWRYLTAFQYRLWRNVIREDGQHREAARAAAANHNSPQASGQTQPAAVAAAPEPALPLAPLVREDYRLGWNKVRPDLKHQMALLQRLVDLCRENQIQLTTVISPLKAWNLEANGPAEIDALTDRLSRITPLWDFNSPPEIAGDDSFWLDVSHFNAKVGTMMLTRVFDGSHESGWGKLKGDTAAERPDPPSSLRSQ
jgi:hypothetical protein